MNMNDYLTQQINRVRHLMRSEQYADLPFELREQVFAFEAYLVATQNELNMKMDHLQDQVQQLEERVELLPATMAKPKLDQPEVDTVRLIATALTKIRADKQAVAMVFEMAWRMLKAADRDRLVARLEYRELTLRDARTSRRAQEAA